MSFSIAITEAFCFYLLLQPGKTLSARKWHAAFTSEGYLDIGKTLSRIQRGVSAPSCLRATENFVYTCSLFVFIKVNVIAYY